MNTISKIMMAAGCGVLIFGGSAFATPVIDTFNGTYAPWDGGATAGGEVTVAPLMPGILPGDVLTTTADPAFTGNYTALGYTAFSFTLRTTSGLNPDQLSLYFASTANNTEWTYTLNSQLLSGNLPAVTTFSGSLTSGWLPLVGSFADFALALTSVSRIGVHIFGQSDVDSAVYQLGDFTLSSGGGPGGGPVPEPETVWMMIAVLASLAVTFRGRIKDVLGAIKA